MRIRNTESTTKVDLRNNVVTDNQLEPGQGTISLLQRRVLIRSIGNPTRLSTDFKTTGGETVTYINRRYQPHRYHT